MRLARLGGSGHFRDQPQPLVPFGRAAAGRQNTDLTVSPHWPRGQFHAFRPVPLEVSTKCPSLRPRPELLIQFLREGRVARLRPCDQFRKSRQASSFFRPMLSVRSIADTSQTGSFVLDPVEFFMQLLMRQATRCAALGRPDRSGASSAGLSSNALPRGSAL